MISVNSVLSLLPYSPPSQLQHTGSVCPVCPITAINVSYNFVENGNQARDLSLVYTLVGDLAQLAVPTPAAPVFTDLLWQQTCCELFIAEAHPPSHSASSAYREFNFSPSGAWAVYDFAAYRERVDAADLSSALLHGLHPTISLQQVAADCLQLCVELPAGLLPSFPTPWHIGITAVIAARTEEKGGKSYWALHHAREQPDFHAWESFTLRYHPCPSALSAPNPSA